MSRKLINFYKNLLALGVCMPYFCFDSANAASSRDSSNVVSSQRASSRNLTQVVDPYTTGSSNSSTSARAATTRSATAPVIRSNVQSRTNQSIVSRSGMMPAVSSRVAGNTSLTARSASNVRVVNGSVNSARSATTPRTVNPSSNVARAAMQTNTVGVARSATTTARVATNGRATAIFNDVSKISTGYSRCREAYATCMDQFCGQANDTYRRCYCSDKYEQFSNTEEALVKATTLLAQFEDNNLNAVNKSAEEVNAMYTATVGEQAIKNDTSAAASILAEVGDLLSGKATNSNANSTSTSLGILSIDFSSDIGDIWSGTSSSGGSIFSSGTGTNMSELAGQELYEESDAQCTALMAENCENDAVLSMAKSSYSIMITQDCNLYEKSIDSKRQAVKETVRTAEKYLREARLEEYRSHNSADVNECMEKVKEELTTDYACGKNYARCLDYTGLYIDTNGQPIYSANLLNLTNLITLSDNQDLLGENPGYNEFLESKKMFAEEALDSCRDIADEVWEEFKKNAIIEIAQAQDEKIEEVKSACVQTIAECYDTQKGALKETSERSAHSINAQAASTAKTLCQDKINACAALYSENADEVVSCTFRDGKIENAADCGLQSLLNFVSYVSETEVAEECSASIQEYLQDLCGTDVEGKEYPWGCRNYSVGTLEDEMKGDITANDMANRLVAYALDSCVTEGETYGELPDQIKAQVENELNKFGASTETTLRQTCESISTMNKWISASDLESVKEDESYKTLDEEFYKAVYNGLMGDAQKLFGVCYRLPLSSTVSDTAKDIIENKPVTSTAVKAPAGLIWGGGSNSSSSSSNTGTSTGSDTNSSNSGSSSSSSNTSGSSSNNNSGGTSGGGSSSWKPGNNAAGGALSIGGFGGSSSGNTTPAAGSNKVF